MFIVDQQRTIVENFNIANAMGLSGRQIVITFPTHNAILGTYFTPERAQEVFKQILAEAFTPTIIFQNVEPTVNIEEFINNRKFVDSTVYREPKVECIEARVFYMPEE